MKQPSIFRIPLAITAVSLLLLKCTIISAQVLTFNQNYGTTSWIENNYTWELNSGTITNTIPHEGAAAWEIGPSYSTTSTLTSNINFTIQSLWLRYGPDNFNPSPGGFIYITGYNTQGQQVNFHMIDHGAFLNQYFEVVLNWPNVRSISVSIEQIPEDMMNPHNPSMVHVDAMSYVPIKQDQAITFGALPSKTLGDEPFELNASASSGLNVSYQSSNEQVATVTNNTVTIVGPGITTITASQSGNDFFNPAADVEQDLIVNENSQQLVSVYPEKLTSIGSVASDVGRSITTDAEGNTYVTGWFSGTTMFGDTQLVSAGEVDIFIAKYDAEGLLVWARRAGGTGGDSSSKVVVFENSVYITGYFEGVANFNTPSAPGSNELTSIGWSDMFVAKYDNAGTFIWAKRAGGPTHESGDGLAVSESSVYITGYFTETANFNTPSAGGSNEITSAGVSDCFIARYDHSGILQWVKRAGGSDNDSGREIVVSGDLLYLTGTVTGTANFNNPSAGGSNEISSAGMSDIFVASYNINGTFLWARRAGGTSADQGLGIAISASSVYVSGAVRGTANFNNPSAGGSNEITSAGDYDAFLAKYDLAGEFLWAKRLGGTGIDVALAVNQFDDLLHVTGYFRNTANFDTPSSGGSNEIMSAGNDDMFVVRYTEEGSLHWVKRAGGTGADVGRGVCVFGESVYVVGSFEATANFNTPSAGGINEITSLGNKDIFIARYAPGDEVVREDQTISFDALSEKTVYDEPFVLSAIASSGLAVSYVSSNLDVAIIIDGTLTIMGPGVTTITASQPGNNSFNAAENVQQQLIVIDNSPNYDLLESNDVRPDQVKAAGSTSDDQGRGLTVDSDGNVYVTGYFTDTASFGEIQLVSAGGTDIFIAKYNSAGVFTVGETCRWGRRNLGNRYRDRSFIRCCIHYRMV